MQTPAQTLPAIGRLDAFSAGQIAASCFHRADGIAARRFSLGGAECVECAECAADSIRNPQSAIINFQPRGLLVELTAGEDGASRVEPSGVLPEEISGAVSTPEVASPHESELGPDAPNIIADCGLQIADSSASANPQSATRNPQLTDFQVARATEILQGLRTVASLLLQAPGTSFNRACHAGGVPKATAWRGKDDLVRTFATPPFIGADGTVIAGWMRDLETHPADALLRAVAPELSTGRPPKFQLTEDEANALRCLVMARSTMDAMHFSIAVEQFASHPACRPETRDIITAELDRAARLRREPHWPVSIRRCGYITKEEAAMFRGEKTEQSINFTTTRGLFWIDEVGKRHEMRAHSVREYDDQSDNEARAYFDPDTGRHEIARQALYSYDVFSAGMLSLMQVSRARDEYRIEDIAEFTLLDFTTNGIPEILRLEAGRRWQNKWFHGFAPEVPGWPEDEKWGGITALCRVINVHGSKSKGGVESSFNLMQVISAHQSTSLGRFRGEFERQTRKLIHAHLTGDCADFWSADAAPARMAEVCRQFNLRPKTRTAMGRDKIAPADLLRDAKGVALPESERWRFCAVKRLATVRNGHVQCTVEHYPQPFRFVVNGLARDVHFDHGYQVLVAFNPSRPEEGCHVFNAECTTRNRNGYGRGEFIVRAPRAELAPQVDLSGMGDFTRKKEARASVRRSYQSIIEKGVSMDHQQDSHGRAVRIERNAEPVQRIERATAPERAQRNAERGTDEVVTVERVSAYRAPHPIRQDDEMEVERISLTTRRPADDVEIVRL